MARGRKPGFRMSDEHRVKIQNSNVLNALIEHVEGKREMSATQVQAGLGLMRKVLPDLSSASVEHSGEVNHTHEVERGVEDFTSRIARIAARSAEGEATGKPH